MKKQRINRSWLDEQIDFYDFIWEEGIEACGKCINRKLMQDFADGGNQFEQMKKEIIKKFPNRKEAEKEFKNKCDEKTK